MKQNVLNKTNCKHKLKKKKITEIDKGNTGGEVGRENSGIKLFITNIQSALDLQNDHTEKPLFFGFHQCSEPGRVLRSTSVL